MDSVLYYCCIWKGGRVLFHYDKVSSGEIKDLAALCLEMTPPYHKWYFHTTGRKTFGFLTEEDDGGFIYFAIVDQSIGKSRLLRFLRVLRDESKKRMANTDRPWNILQNEQLLRVVERLVASLERDEDPWSAHNDFTPHHRASSSCNDDAEVGSDSTRVNKREEKKVTKDHVIVVRGDHIEMEEDEHHHRLTQMRGANDDFVQETSSSSSDTYPKDFNSTRILSDSQQPSLHEKWCRQARIVLAINAAVCIVLFAVWLAICHGMKCIR